MKTETSQKCKACVLTPSLTETIFANLHFYPIWYEWTPQDNQTESCRSSWRKGNGHSGFLTMD